MLKMDELRVIISGGGTGGHIFPAVSIANAIREKRPDAKILFVGAEGRMEMQRVPAAGYEIKGLPIAGFDRKHLLKNISVLLKIMKSQRMAKQIIKDFQPQVAVGVGGYASGPTLNMAAKAGIPTLLQEQNSYAGVTNKLLAKKAQKICGGSLGARTVNESILTNLNLIRRQTGIQFIWQTGKYYSESIHTELEKAGCPDNLKVMDFISDMKSAYAAADLVISRAGAGSISEFCLLGKPVILVPSPNVSEDHQTKNALALVQKDAAIYVKDDEAQRTLLPLAINTVSDNERLKTLSKNILLLARPNAASDIADEVLKLAQQ